MIDGTATVAGAGTVFPDRLSWFLCYTCMIPNIPKYLPCHTRRKHATVHVGIRGQRQPHENHEKVA
jgi:hypothetical protein